MQRLIFFFLLVLAPIFGIEWNQVYLASFPRSGNHWVRFLIEEATHIATSSVYCDKDFPHLSTPFPWGGYCTVRGYDGNCRYPTPNDPVILKTHYPFYPKKIDSGRKAICLIRHPVDVFWSFYVYKHKKTKPIEFDEQLLVNWISRWRKFYEFWENQPEVLLIRYEDLQQNPQLQLARILQTAGFSFDQADIERAVSKRPPQGTSLKHIDSYDPKMIKIIKRRLGDFLIKYNYDL